MLRWLGKDALQLKRPPDAKTYWREATAGQGLLEQALLLGGQIGLALGQVGLELP